MRGADELRRVLAQTRREAVHASTVVGRQRLAKLLAQAEADLRKRLAAVPRSAGGPGRDSFTGAQMRVALRQIEDATKLLVGGLKGVVVGQAVGVADASAGQVVEYLEKAERAFRGSARPLRLDEATILDRARSGVESSVLRRLGSSGGPEEGAAPEAHRAKPGILQRYGMSVVGHFEEVLRVGMVARKPWAEIRADLTAASPFLQGAPAHWAERIVRTETMGAANRAGWEGIRAADEQLKDMCKVLAATFDDRTGWDSFQVHGQIRRPNEPFEWADGSYMHPPNRPNDREVVVPHRVAWPIPPQLAQRGDAEVLAAWKRAGRKGSPPPRTWARSTIPLARFGAP